MGYFCTDLPVKLQPNRISEEVKHQEEKLGKILRRFSGSPCSTEGQFCGISSYLGVQPGLN